MGQDIEAARMRDVGCDADALGQWIGVRAPQRSAFRRLGTVSLL